MPGRSAPNNLRSYLLRLASNVNTPSSIKATVSIVRELEKVVWVQPINSAADFLFAKAVVQLHPGAGLTVEHWGSSSMFKALVGSTRTLEDWELVALAVVAAGESLRVGEAAVAVPSLHDRGRCSFMGKRAVAGGRRHSSDPIHRLGPKFWPSYASGSGACR